MLFRNTLTVPKESLSYFFPNEEVGREVVEAIRDEYLKHHKGQIPAYAYILGIRQTSHTLLRLFSSRSAVL